MLSGGAPCRSRNISVSLRWLAGCIRTEIPRQVPTFAKASAFAKASTFAKATADKTADKTAGKTVDKPG
jgi:hypothetical protein